MPIKLNLGSGNKPLEGYVNIDFDPMEKEGCITVKGDARNLSQYNDNSVDEIFASHIIEHFDLIEVEGVMKEWYRVIKPGGKIVIECPDLVKCAINLLQILSTNDTKAVVNNGMWGFYGDPTVPNTPGARHLWGYWPSSITNVLTNAGFKDIVFEEPKSKPWAAKTRDMRAVGTK